jgi:lipopolysaccharide export system ATP-binding protein
VGSAILLAEGVCFSRGRTELLREVSLQLEPGRVLGVLGPSGAGKSTLFRILAGELVASAGRVVLCGKDVSRAPLWARARAGLGYVPQGASVLWDLTVRENIRTFERIARARKRDAEVYASELDLVARLDLRASALSGGERRRLELLRALLAEPRVLILDEPLSGLDPAGAALVCRVLKSRAASGMALALADHRVREALSICDEALLLNNGRIELHASASEFPDHPAVKERYLS